MSSDNKRKTYRIEALGCRTNQYEAQGFRDQLLQMGFEEASNGESADLCVINTCTVTQSADGHSRHLIRQLIRDNPDSKVIVTGCLAERDPLSIQQIEGVDYVVSNAKKEQLIQDLFPDEDVPEFSIKNFDAHTRAFVKVQDGCNSFCTYCIIPYVRGRSRSRPIDDILREIEALISNGFKEIVLTGINIGDYDGGPNKPHRLVDLVQAVDTMPGLHRLRISSIDPDEIDIDLQNAVLRGKHTCHSMHIVLQSGSNAVLKRMNRKYTRQVFQETVRRLQAEDPDFTVTTDIIVGFPGETDIDFQETLDVMKNTQFAKVHMFPYSDRPRTKAHTFPDKVPSDIIHTRKQEVLHLSEQLAFSLREPYIGKTATILTEQTHDGDRLFGHTENFLGVYIPKGSIQTNELVHVQLIANTAEGLLGKVIG